MGGSEPIFLTPLRSPPSPRSPCLKNAQHDTIHGTPAPASSPSWPQVGPKSLLGGGLGPKCFWEGSWGAGGIVVPNWGEVLRPAAGCLGATATATFPKNS